MRALMVLSILVLSLGSAAFAAEAAPDQTFERAARAEARRQGWPGYPDSYEDAFLAGARWARAKTKKLVCVDKAQSSESRESD